MRKLMAALALVLLVGCGSDRPQVTRPVEDSTNSVRSDDGQDVLRATKITFNGATYVCIRYVGNGGLWCERVVS